MAVDPPEKMLFWFRFEHLPVDCFVRAAISARRDE